MEDLNQFFGSIINSDSKEKFEDFELDNTIGEISFTCAEEFGWSQCDFEECDIPFLFRLLRVRKKVVDERNKQMRKKK